MTMVILILVDSNVIPIVISTDIKNKFRPNSTILRNSPYLSKINSNFPEISILNIYRVEERILHIKLISKHPSYATKLHLEFELQQVKVCPFTVNSTLLTFMWRLTYIYHTFVQLIYSCKLKDIFVIFLLVIVTKVWYLW